MQARGALILFCLFFSGLAALVYQVIWTRLLGFAFGTTTEAIGTVLAVFFAGMAIGNWIAARKLKLVERPIRVYGLLELGIGVFALVSLPLLWRLEGLYALLGSDYPPFAASLLRLVAAAIVLLAPDDRDGRHASHRRARLDRRGCLASGGRAPFSTRRIRSAPSPARTCADSG